MSLDLFMLPLQLRHISLLKSRLTATNKMYVMLTMFGTSTKQVHNVEVRTQVTHDLQLRHQGLSLAPPGCGWRESEKNRESERCMKGRTGELSRLKPGNIVSLPNCSKAHWLKIQPGWQPN